VGDLFLDRNMQSMTMESLAVGWFDLILVAVLIWGGLQGRKYGMSEQLLPLLRWIVAIAVAAFAYRPVGEALAGITPISTLSSYLGAYLLCLLGVFVAFAILKKIFGGKPISGDKFGRSEYYLGVAASVAKFACVIIAVLAFLNARAFSKEEIQRRTIYERDMYGSSFFPRLDTVQAMVFQKSFSGSMLHDHGGFLLIEPTTPQSVQLKRKQYESF
jgi:uncharacterized membrane protein required for colicin V production